jgi:2-hydroxychromene-2-carboxylate isomerase
MVKPEFIFDFGSPNAYLAHRVLPEVERRAGVEFAYTPCLLGGIFKATGNQSPMQANAGIPAKLAYDMLEMRRFIDRHGLVEFRMNPHFPINTLTMMRGAVVAEREGRLSAYVDALFAAMWEKEINLGDPDALKAVLDAAGFSGAALIAATAEDAVKRRLIENTDRAVARGAFGIPTFFVGADMWFGKDRLREVEEALAARRAIH